VPRRIVRLPRLAVNFAILAGGELLSKLFTALAFAYLARVLGPADYGQLEFALAIIMFLTVLVDGGLSPYGAREIAKDPGAAHRLVLHIIVLRGGLAAGAFGVLAALAAAIDQPASVKGLILLYGLTLFGVPGLLAWVFQGRDSMHYVALASVLRWSTFAAGVFLWVHGPGQVWRVALIEAGAVGVAVLFYAALTLRQLGPPRGPLDPTFAFAMLRQAAPIGASELVWATKIYFATVWLGLVVGAAEVGLFGAAHRLVVALHAFVWLYFFNLLPSLARCTREPLDRLRALLQRSTQLCAWTAVFVGVVGTAFAQPLLTLVYGSQYLEAVPAFQVLIWLVPLALMSGNYRYALLAYGHQRLEFLTAAFGAGLNVLLNVLLIPSYGLLGAASALVASEALIWGVAYCYVRRAITSVPVGRHLAGPLAVGTVLAGALYLLAPSSPWLAAGSAVLVYGLALAIIRPSLLADVGSLADRDR
jgi:O-antigen/teichoic acid export membrane protein